MKCAKCGSENVTVQVINEVKLKNKHHGVIWWLFIGWWWIPFKWLFLTIPALIIKIFGGKKQKNNLRLFLPVNARRFFNSHSLRNFMLYIRTTGEFRDKDLSFDKIFSLNSIIF